MEIKTSVGDDCPSILCQINQQKLAASRLKSSYESSMYDKCKFVLLIDTFSSAALNKQQLVQFFSLSNVKVLFFDEI